MHYYRIMSVDYHKSPYSCSTNAGRWNPKGSRMIYAGSSPSLSLLEYLSIRGDVVAIKPWYVVVYEITNDNLVGTLDKDDLPSDWNLLPHGRSTQSFGKMWLDEKALPFLKVPSARLNLAFYPEEHNLLINPDYPDLTSLLRVINNIPFNYLLGT